MKRTVIRLFIGVSLITSFTSCESVKDAIDSVLPSAPTAPITGGPNLEPIVLAPARPASPPLTEDQLDAAHLGVHDALLAVAAQTNLSATEQNSRILTAVRALPNVYDAGNTTNGDMWIRLKDGTPVAIYSDPRRPWTPAQGNPLEQPFFAANQSGKGVWKQIGATMLAGAAHVGNWILPSVVAQVARTFALPTSKKALLIPVDELSPNSSAAISAMLSDKKYQVNSLSAPSVTNLRTIVNDIGVMWYGTHGVYFASEDETKKGIQHYGLLTGDQINSPKCTGPADICDPIRADFRAGRIYIAFDKVTAKGSIVIGGGFIRQYWHFANKSVAVIDACNSTMESWANQEFLDGLRYANLGTLVGWTMPVTAGFAEQAVTFFFDRVLGSSTYTPPSPKQRPFSVQEVVQAMKDKGKDIDPSGGARFSIKPYIAEEAILLPSIRNFAVDEEAHTLEAFGEFGSVPGSLEIAGTPLSIQGWSDTKLILTLPISGAGAKGLGIVKSSGTGLESNPVPLTEWQGTYRGRHVQNGMFGDAGPWFQLDCSKVRIRADVHEYRFKPEETPAAGYSSELFGGERDVKVPIRNATSDSLCIASTGGMGEKASEDGSEVYRYTYAGISEPVSWSVNVDTPASGWWFVVGYWVPSEGKVYPNFNSRGTTQTTLTVQKIQPAPADPAYSMPWGQSSVAQVGYMMSKRGYAFDSTYNVHASDRFDIIFTQPTYPSFPGMPTIPTIPGGIPSTGDRGEADLNLNADSATIPKADTPG